MGRVKIKDLQPAAEATRKAALWGLIRRLGLAVNRIFKAYGGYVLVVNDDKVESFIATNTKETFNSDGFEIIEPPELQSKRTLVLTGVDEYILSFTEQELKEAIMTSRPSLKVTKVIKLPDNAPVMKVQLETIQMVQDSITAGIVVNGQSFSNNNITQDIFVHIPQCMRCYSYEHVRKDCKKPDNYLICSNCASLEHRYTNCHSVFKKCITCSGDHPTMAARCARRKAIMKNTAKGIRSQSQARPSNYAQATTSNTSTTNSAPFNLPQQAPWPGTPTKHITVIHAAIIFANMREIVQPGTFQDTFSRILAKNGLPDVLIPDDVLVPHEMAKLGLSSNTSNNNNDENEDVPEEDMTGVHEFDNRKRNHEHDSDDSDSVSNANTKAVRREETTSAPQQTVPVEQASTSGATAGTQSLQPSSLGLKLYSASSFNVPKKATNQQLIGFIKSKQLKYQYTVSHPEQTVHDSIMKGEIVLIRTPIQPVVATKFKSIRQGYYNLSGSRTSIQH